MFKTTNEIIAKYDKQEIDFRGLFVASESKWNTKLSEFNKPTTGLITIHETDTPVSEDMLPLKGVFHYMDKENPVSIADTKGLGIVF